MDVDPCVGTFVAATVEPPIPEMVAVPGPVSSTIVDHKLSDAAAVIGSLLLLWL